MCFDTIIISCGVTGQFTSVSYIESTSMLIKHKAKSLSRVKVMFIGASSGSNGILNIKI